jgi:hypothetical protein
LAAVLASLSPGTVVLADQEVVVAEPLRERLPVVLAHQVRVTTAVLVQAITLRVSVLVVVVAVVGRWAVALRPVKEGTVATGLSRPLRELRRFLLAVVVEASQQGLTALVSVLGGRVVVETATRVLV